MNDYITAEELKYNNIKMLKAARDGEWEEAFAWQASLWCDALGYAVNQNNEKATLECLDRWLKEEYVDDDGKFDTYGAIWASLIDCVIGNKHDLLKKMCTFLKDFADGTRYERANFCSGEGIDLLITEETLKHLFDHVLSFANHLEMKSKLYDGRAEHHELEARAYREKAKAFSAKEAKNILKDFGADTDENFSASCYLDLFDTIYGESFDEALEKMENGK